LEKTEKTIEKSTKTAFQNSQERMMPMNLRIEPTLYIDLQAAVPAGFCPKCGGAVYKPGLYCLRCEAACHDPS
jgi:hypothetical protein